MKRVEELYVLSCFGIKKNVAIACDDLEESSPKVSEPAILVFL
jgi:hypothetical protein